MLKQIRERMRREFLAWSFGKELASAIEYGSIVITIHKGAVTDIDVTISDRPQAVKQSA